ncbi:hypothetical protein D3C83_59940 [compost metagenome]
MNGTTVSTLKPTSTPSTTPATVPMTPISAPCTMKICTIEPGEAPSVRRMAMSACLSVTSITCEDTRLNAPIAISSESRIAITVFSIFSARNMLAFSPLQSLTR